MDARKLNIYNICMHLLYIIYNTAREEAEPGLRTAEKLPIWCGGSEAAWAHGMLPGGQARRPGCPGQPPPHKTSSEGT